MHLSKKPNIAAILNFDSRSEFSKFLKLKVQKKVVHTAKCIKHFE